MISFKMIVGVYCAVLLVATPQPVYPEIPL